MWTLAKLVDILRTHIGALDTSITGLGEAMGMMRENGRLRKVYEVTQQKSLVLTTIREHLQKLLLSTEAEMSPSEPSTIDELRKVEEKTRFIRDDTRFAQQLVDLCDEPQLRERESTIARTAATTILRACREYTDYKEVGDLCDMLTKFEAKGDDYTN